MPKRIQERINDRMKKYGETHHEARACAFDDVDKEIGKTIELTILVCLVSYALFTAILWWLSF